MKIKIAVFDTKPADCAATADAIRVHYEAIGQRAITETYTEAYPFVQAFEEGGFAMAFLTLNNPLHLDTARKAGAIAPECPLFIVSDTGDYGLEAHRLMALDYLMKPVTETDIATAVGRISTPFGRSRRRN